MLKEMGVEYVIIGHSERRQYFGETDETVNLRVQGRAGRRAEGHPLRRRAAGAARAGHHRRGRLAARRKVALQGVGAEALKNVIIAYEPVWAIGTGQHRDQPSRRTRSAASSAA